ncbi:hypothetical protein [Streptomyces apricus]|uniref:Uncharacterized protein n=1 Tax=Streptomyces apricus TaxID=1828112 RepID=A0A5B0BQV7_9ACTN|nr:hypothetical protein [Streptomyces apricus]KAA0943205.1 hypothetical protein FGF04_00185 [Streptomyces apricus]
MVPPATAVLLEHVLAGGTTSEVFNTSGQIVGALAVAVFGVLISGTASFWHGLRVHRPGPGRCRRPGCGADRHPHGHRPAWRLTLSTPAVAPIAHCPIAHGCGEGRTRPGRKHVGLVDAEEATLGAFLDNSRRRAAELSPER